MLCSFKASLLTGLYGLVVVTTVRLLGSDNLREYFPGIGTFAQPEFTSSHLLFVLARLQQVQP